MHERRPLVFSAAHTALFEQARRQSRERVQPQFLWKRGFHSEGGRAGWGYYLEPAPSEASSATESDRERREGSTDAEEDIEDDGHAENRHEERVGHAGNVKRPRYQDTGYPASRTKVIASHGACLDCCQQSHPRLASYHHTHAASASNSPSGNPACKDGSQDPHPGLPLVRAALPLGSELGFQAQRAQRDWTMR